MLAAKSSASTHKTRWRYLVALSVGLPLVGAILSFLAISGTLASRFVAAGISFVFTGLVIPTTAPSILLLLRRPKSDAKTRPLQLAIGLLSLLVIGFWSALDLLIPLGLSFEIFQIVTGMFFSVGALSLVSFLIRVIRKRRNQSRVN